ncbi:MAG TPA: MEDS domain-containing protein [Armatimonadota bacterium]|nr:MEDS domain-containing protein [Armatimonadota bacterium]
MERTAASLHRHASRPELRATGIDVIGDVSWGTHFCQFYQNQQDLIDILIPYFKAGLEHNEFCMWITSAPLQMAAAYAALAQAVDGLDNYFHSGQIEILDYREWYTPDGHFDADRVLHGWVDKLTTARQRGFSGLRLSGNTFWLEQSTWRDFTEYEAAVDNVIGRYPMMAMCTYSLAKCGAVEILEVMSNHAFALIKHSDKWHIVESSERQKVKEALDQANEDWGRTFNSVPDLMALLDNDHHIVRVNRALADRLGVTPEECIGMHCYEAIHALPHAPAFCPHALTCCDGHEHIIEVHEPRLGGDFVVSTTPRFNDAGQFIGTLHIARDITERKRSEEEREHLLDQMKSFVHMVSHDLRAPLTIMNGYASVLLDELHQSDDPLLRTSAESIMRGVKRMDTMIGDLVDAARLEGGQMHLKRTPIALPTYLPALLTRNAGILNTERIELHVADDLVPVTADDERLERILINLLTNAQKYSAPNTTIHLHAQQTNQEVQLAIIDQGNGIPPDDIPHLFDRFYRGKGERRAEGIGLGLYITKLLVEAHEGHIWVESHAGQGSTFFFTLPVCEHSDCS